MNESNICFTRNKITPHAPLSMILPHSLINKEAGMM